LGFGLNYTKFVYSSLKLSKRKIRKNETITAEVTVTNSGNMQSDEVVQLYLTHEAAQNVPLYSLKGFKRISLKPGASEKVPFTITPEMMKVIDEEGKSVLNAGKIKIDIGGSLPSQRSIELGAPRPATAQIIIQ
jgi:beta-glucosidase